MTKQLSCPKVVQKLRTLHFWKLSKSCPKIVHPLKKLSKSCPPGNFWITFSGGGQFSYNFWTTSKNAKCATFGQLLDNLIVWSNRRLSRDWHISIVVVVVIMFLLIFKIFNSVLRPGTITIGFSAKNAYLVVVSSSSRRGSK